MLVDTNGFILAVIVHSAEIRDGTGAELLFNEAKGKFPRVELIWVDAAYHSKALQAWVKQECGWRLEVVKKPSRWGRYPIDVEPPAYPGFTVLKWRWIVERTFGWLGRWRRMAKDYEALEATQVAIIYAAMLRVMCSRLVRHGSPIREVRNQTQPALQ